MASTWLRTLKVRVDHLIMAGVAVAVLGGGAWMWRSLASEDAERDEAEEGSVVERLKSRRDGGSRGKLLEDDGKQPRFVRGYMPSARAEKGEGVAVHQPPPQKDPGDLDAHEAVAAYESIVADLEQALEDERKLTKREQAELYNRASGSLTALSAWADPQNAGDRALLDDAYLQLKSLMRELDIKPPRHDPDPPLPRR